MKSVSAIDDEKAVVPALRRRFVLNLAGLSLLSSLAACSKSGIFIGKEISITVVMYSFLDRPIFEIHLDGSDIGGANSFGTTSMVTGVAVTMGEQKLSWRLDGPKGKPRNGETVALKNRVIINPHDIPRAAQYMGVYLYPDDTAEFVFTEFMPGREGTVRSKAITKELGK
jgi:hypothetical protein